MFPDSLCTSISSSNKSSMFRWCLKFADVAPLQNKRRKDANQNYRPISILSSLSKIYQRNMFKQMLPSFENICSKYQCGFRKVFSTQQYVLTLLEKC